MLTMLFRNKGVLVRRAVFLTAFIGAAVLTCWSQQSPPSKPNVSDVLTKLHSKHASERTDALDQIASDQALLHSRKVQTALLDLLNQENEAFREDTSFNSAAATDATDEGEEEYSQYLSSLSYVVNEFVDWSDPRQACTMVYSGDIYYPSSAPEAAARARAAMPCLMKWNKSNHAIYREIAIPLLIEAVKEARGTLTPQTAQTAKQFILSGLRDADVGVRSATVIALDRFGGTDMIPALEEVAAKDPAPEVEGHSIRKSAAEAIAEIQKRESQR
jgi:HEAT repeat protein